MFTGNAFSYVTPADFWLILAVKTFFAALIGKNGYEKRAVGVFQFYHSLVKYRKERLLGLLTSRVGLNGCAPYFRYWHIITVIDVKLNVRQSDLYFTVQ